MFGLMSTAWCRKPGIAAVGFLLSVSLTCIFSIRPSNNCGAILSGSSQKAHHISTLLATKYFFGWNKFELAPSHYCNSGWLSAAPVSLAVNLLQGAGCNQGDFLYDMAVPEPLRELCEIARRLRIASWSWSWECRWVCGRRAGASRGVRVVGCGVLGGCKLAISATKPHAVPKSIFSIPKFRRQVWTSDCC